MSWAESQQVDPVQVEQYFARAGNTPERGCRIVNSWMEWLASGSRREGMREVDRGESYQKQNGRIRPGHQSFFEYKILLLFSRFHLRPDRLHFRRAEFEFRNLPERIEGRIGQDVRRRFDKGERDASSTSPPLRSRRIIFGVVPEEISA